MKLYKFLLSAAACAALTACSSDDDILGSGDNTLPEGKAYIKVNISTDPSAGTRADTLVQGTDTEYAIKNIRFMFYDENGENPQAGMVLGNVGMTNDDTSGGNIDAHATSAVIAFEAKTNPNKNFQLVAFANLTNDEWTKVTQATTLENAMAEVVDNPVAVINSTKYMKMSNSVYAKDSKIKSAISVKKEEFKKTAAEAIASPVSEQINLERMAARFDMTAKTFTYAQPNAATVTDGQISYLAYVNGEATASDGSDKYVILKLNLKGWGLNALNKETFMLKNLDKNWASTNPYEGWNASDKNRSFWAVDKNYDTSDYANVSEDVNETGNTTKKDLEFVTWSSIGNNGVNSSGNIEATTCTYFPENTLTNAEYTNSGMGAATHLLLTGQYQVKTVKDPTATINDDNWESGFTTFYIWNGYYFKTADNLKAAMLAKVKTQLQNTETDEFTGTVTLVNATTKGESKWILTTDATSAYKVGGSTISTNAEINAEIEEIIGYADMYKDAKCYFATPIVHNGDGNGDKSSLGYYGAVRNHIYQLTINKIEGIGSGISHPEQDGGTNPSPIVPEKETNKYYLGVSINVLTWAKRTWSVNF